MAAHQSTEVTLSHAPAGVRANDLVLGLDVGTTTMKAALFDLEALACPVVVARTDSPTAGPRPGWSECDPAMVIERLGECVRAVLTAIDPRQIRAIGTSGTACGAWLLAGGAPVRPAILWNDGRAADIVRAWHDSGLIAAVFERSGNVPFPGYTLPVLRWLIENEPENLERSEVSLFCKDWIRYWLTGFVGSDETDASYAPFDIRKRRWDDDLLQLTGTSAARRLLPEILEPTRTDPLSEATAAELGLPAGIPVAVGATDIIAGCVGGGAVEPGQAVTILGTSANSSLVTETAEFEPREVGIMAAAPLGRWVRTMLNTSGSTTLDWAAHLLTGGDVPQLLELASTAADSSDLPSLVPYLANAGVVSPFVDPRARGALVGLRTHHGPAEIARAAVEGLAFAVADSLASMPTKVVEITAIGGAARSDQLLQAIADTTAAQIMRPRGEEFGARGVALLAATSAGLLSETELATSARRLDVDRRFEPQPGVLEARLDRYRACSANTRALSGLW